MIHDISDIIAFLIEKAIIIAMVELGFHILFVIVLMSSHFRAIDRDNKKARKNNEYISSVRLLFFKSVITTNKGITNFKFGI